MQKVISRISSCINQAFPSPQPKGRGVNVKQVMCHIRTGRFFPRFWPVCRPPPGPAAQPGRRHRAGFAGSLTAQPKASACQGLYDPAPACEGDRQEPAFRRAPAPAQTRKSNGDDVHDLSAIRLRTLASGGIAGAGREVDRAWQNTVSSAATTIRTRSRSMALADAVNAVLRREGRTLATYGLASGPQGYRPLREFLTTKLKRDAGIDCVADDILIVSGSLQALDLVNATLLARGDTIITEQDTYQGALNRLTPARRQHGRHPARRGRHADGRAGGKRWPTSRPRASRRNTSTPSRPCRTRPAPSCRRRAAPSC